MSSHEKGVPRLIQRGTPFDNNDSIAVSVKLLQLDQPQLQRLCHRLSPGKNAQFIINTS